MRKCKKIFKQKKSCVVLFINSIANKKKKKKRFDGIGIAN